MNCGQKVGLRGPCTPDLTEVSGFLALFQTLPPALWLCLCCPWVLVPWLRVGTAEAGAEPRLHSCVLGFLSPSLCPSQASESECSSSSPGAGHFASPGFAFPSVKWV